MRMTQLHTSVLIVGLASSILAVTNDAAGQSGTVTASPGRARVTTGRGTIDIISPDIAPVPNATVTWGNNRTDGQLGVASQQRVIIKDSGQDLTVQCRDRDVSIRGNDNIVRFTGNCRSVTITGGNNVLTIEAAAAIVVTGASNKVSWAGGGGGKAPKVTDTGAGNVIAQLNRAEPPGATPNGTASAGTAVVTAQATSPAGAGSPSSDEQADAIEIYGASEVHDVDCKGRSVTIEGASHNVILRGSCKGVNVEGTNNTVSIEATSEIAVDGTNNTVTWVRGIDGATPSITKEGRKNSIKQVASLASGAADDSPATKTKANAESARGKGGQVAVSDGAGTVKVTGVNGKAGGNTPTVVAQATPTTEETLTLGANDETRTIDCSGNKNVAILGNRNNLTLRGTCHTISVLGNSNSVAAEAVKAISAMGSANKVTWLKGMDGPAPHIVSMGSNNSIERRQ